jgi:hypothetical protein
MTVLGSGRRHWILLHFPPLSCVSVVDQGSRALQGADPDHVITGTGYDWNVSLLPFLDPNLQRSIHRTEHAPSLNLNFESSVKGLYFIGPMSAMSFGPLFRFVAGAGFSVRMVARHLAGPFPLARAAVNSGLKTVPGPPRHKASSSR